VAVVRDLHGEELLLRLARERVGVEARREQRLALEVERRAAERGTARSARGGGTCVS
jgi:hypothetical protein